jgi:hypothetical protein
VVVEVSDGAVVVEVDGALVVVVELVVVEVVVVVVLGLGFAARQRAVKSALLSPSLGKKSRGWLPCPPSVAGLPTSCTW